MHSPRLVAQEINAKRDVGKREGIKYYSLKALLLENHLCCRSYVWLVAGKLRKWRTQVEPGLDYYTGSSVLL